MNKVMRIGTMEIGQGRRANIFIKAEVKDGELSITGVIGPLHSGNALGGCGQIDMEFAHRNPVDNDRRTTALVKPKDIQFAPGWTAGLWYGLLDIWHNWHLNHMKAGCEHQIGPEWETTKEITLFYFRARKHVSAAIHNYTENAKAALRGGYAIQATPEEQRLALLPDRLTLASAELTPELARDYEPNGPQYQGDSYNKPSETKMAGWVTPEAHPGGLLTKACAVCGYKYGTSWKKVELPQAVIDKLASFPDTDKQPAWV